jgi:hypothetical protein
MPTQTDQQNYTVSRTFTDSSGVEWREGANFTGDEKAIAKALREGNIKENQPSQQPAQGQQGQGQQTGQAQPKRTS